jgi:hypothetical protein
VRLQRGIRPIGIVHFICARLLPHLAKHGVRPAAGLGVLAEHYLFPSIEILKTQVFSNHHRIGYLFY